MLLAVIVKCSYSLLLLTILTPSFSSLVALFVPNIGAEKHKLQYDLLVVAGFGLESVDVLAMQKDPKHSCAVRFIHNILPQPIANPRLSLLTDNMRHLTSVLMTSVFLEYRDSV